MSNVLARDEVELQYSSRVTVQNPDKPAFLVFDCLPLQKCLFVLKDVA